MKQRKIKIKGNTWTIKYLNSIDKYNWGSTDSTSKIIRLYCKEPKDSDLDNFQIHMNHILRHELVHAFLDECGLQDQLSYTRQGHDEKMVDWFAYMYPEYKKVCDELGV